MTDIVTAGHCHDGASTASLDARVFIPRDAPLTWNPEDVAGSTWSDGEMPLVSIIMPVHNAAPFLQDAIDSILAQTHKGPMELIVFDDGPSTDHSRAILESNRSVLAARGITLKIVAERTATTLGSSTDSQGTKSYFDDSNLTETSLDSSTDSHQTETILDRSTNGHGDCFRNAYSGHCRENDGGGGSVHCDGCDSLSACGSNGDSSSIRLSSIGGSGGSAETGTALRGAPLLSEGSAERCQPRGCGFGRNRAIEHSRGEYLCFADGDDVMAPGRISRQLALASQSHKLLVGSNFVRTPADATPRLTAWANSLSQVQLYLQQLVETTLIAPTWFCSRQVFKTAGPFDESGPGTPDDLMFFHQHLANGGWLAKVPEPLLTYCFHSASVTGSRGCPWESIWEQRVKHLQAQLLSGPSGPCWSEFTIWNAGKEGRRLYRSLSPSNQAKVIAFCDVDVRKIARGVYMHHESGRAVPVIHWSEARPPLLLCVKRGLTGGGFEEIVESLDMTEGLDYVYFS
ncbi:hypothetical protein CLOM_g10655 [Closterium sp. NIES-68]|nr:hypothetical protein CLOM_g19045 [Closterium sp. NIES-68]GJP51490.1 hypothetical protein CLOM_g10655 [Closterium sp. NIES-68]GJP84637.1 hypothetical protein CLOP_g14689 [Closterium sp. NIES-67]